MCGGLQGMMGQQMAQNDESSDASKWNVLDPLTIKKTRDAIHDAKTRGSDRTTEDIITT